MAKLDVLTRQPDKIVLGKGGVKNFGNLIGLLIFGAVVCAGMSAFLEDGAINNPILVVIGIIVGLSILSSLLGALRSTRVVIDGPQHVATRHETLFFIPVRHQELALNAIRDVQVTAARSSSSSRRAMYPIWQVQLRAADGSALLVNERGAHAEMRALADEVGALLKRPVRDVFGDTAAAPARSAPEAPFVKTSVRQAQQQAAASAPILAASARQVSQQSAADAAIQQTSARMQAQSAAANAPVLQTSAMLASDQLTANAPALQTSALQAYDQTVAGAPMADETARQTQAQVSANMPVFEMGMRMAFSQMSAFESDATIRAQMTQETAAAGAPFAESSARLAQQQSAATFTVEYALPPMTEMAQFPAFAAFPPMMDLPALEPLGMDTLMSSVGSLALSASQWDLPELESFRESELRVESDDLRTRFQTARQLQRQGNFKAAHEAYENALDLDPGGVEIHNDLGVLFFEHNKLHDAEREFRQAVALDPFFVPARYNLGLTLQRLGNRSAAQEQFRFGASNTPEQARDFQDALRGKLHAPLLSAS